MDIPHSIFAIIKIVGSWMVELWDGTWCHRLQGPPECSKIVFIMKKKLNVMKYN